MRKINRQVINVLLHVEEGISVTLFQYLRAVSPVEVQCDIKLLFSQRCFTLSKVGEEHSFVRLIDEGWKVEVVIKLYRLVVMCESFVQPCRTAADIADLQRRVG